MEELNNLIKMNKEKVKLRNDASRKVHSYLLKNNVKHVSVDVDSMNIILRTEYSLTDDIIRNISEYFNLKLLKVISLIEESYYNEHVKIFEEKKYIFISKDGDY